MNSVKVLWVHNYIFNLSKLPFRLILRYILLGFFKLYFSTLE